MRMTFNCSIDIDIASPQLEEIHRNFCKITQILLKDFFRQVLLEFANYYMELSKKPFCCKKCSNNKHFIWKTRHSKATYLTTVFGLLHLLQLQVQCKECGHKMYITRELLGIEPRKRIPMATIRRLGLIGALTTFRVAEKIVGMFGVTLDKMSLWRSVQRLSDEIKFDLDPEECAEGEADGTGIPIRGIKKRGKEMKVFVQPVCARQSEKEWRGKNCRFIHWEL